MPDNFGTPDAHDAVARDEKTVQEAAQYAVELDEAMKEMYPRTLGSVKVSSADRMAEWQTMKDTPEHLSQFFVDNNATVEQMVQHAKEMLRRENG